MEKRMTSPLHSVGVTYLPGVSCESWAVEFVS